jgi:hypothetical protein
MEIEAEDPVSWGESSCRYTHIAARSAATGSRRSRISALSLKSPVPSAAASSSVRLPRPHCSSRAPDGISTTTRPRPRRARPINPGPTARPRRPANPSPRRSQSRLLNPSLLQASRLRSQRRAVLQLRRRSGQSKSGRSAVVVSHPRDQNKDVARMGHPQCVWFDNRSRAPITSVYLLPEPVLKSTTRSFALRNPLASR